MTIIELELVISENHVKYEVSMKPKMPPLRVYKERGFFKHHILKHCVYNSFFTVDSLIYYWTYIFIEKKNSFRKNNVNYMNTVRFFMKLFI